MMQGWKRLVAVMAALTLVLSMCPVQWLQTAAQAEAATGTVTADGVFLRKQPSKTADYWFKLDTGFVCEVQDVVTSGGVTWYKVKSAHPTSSTTNTYIGYIHGDYFVLNSAGGAEDSTVKDDVPEGAGGSSDPDGDSAADSGSTGSTGGTGSTGSTGGTETTYLVGEVNADQVNFRKTAGGELIDKLNKGDRVEILSVPAAVTVNDWYKVRYNGKEGYIQAPYLTVVGTSVTAPDDYGFVKLILSSANLRSAPSGTVLAQWTTKGEVLPVTGPTQSKDGYSWYPVLYKGAYYFVREDCVQKVSSADGGSTSTDGSTVTAKGYLKTTKSGVNLRLQPGGDVIQQVKKGVVVTRLSDLVSAAGYSWYLVQVDSVRGYMRSDCVTFVNSDGSVTTPPAATVTTPPTVTDGAYGYVITTAKGVNLRAKPAGTSQEQIDKGVIMPMTGYAVVSGKYTWYPVRAASGRTGYVRGDCATPCTSDGTATTAPTAPSGGTVVTPPPSTASYGYVMIKSNNVNVRKTEGGSVIGQVDKGTVWPMTGVSTTKNGYTWYPIKADGLTGYVRGDHSFKLSPTQEASYLAGNGVPDESGSSSGSGTAVTQYVQTILDKVNLRASASKDANAPYNVAIGTVMAYNSSQSVGGSLWYRVIYDNTEVWVLGSCVKVMTQAEYEAYLATKPAATPQPSVIKGYIKTTVSDVNLRATAGGTSILGRLAKNLVLPYSESTTARNYTWYKVQTNLGTGYVRGDCAEICDKDGNAVVTPTTPGGSTGTGQEATYSTLRRGSTGTAVTNLVTELKLQGYYTGEITSSYTSAVEDAVKKFQKANGLTVDGIAGSQTQHKLYGTVPVGEGDSSNLTMTIYPAEKIDWFTGGIQTLWAKGSSYKVYDVKTGIVWWARRWSGAYHADVEPLTAADTARLCKIYGVNSAQEIKDKNLWQRRPCLVTIGSRTFACSLYGIPHNYPDGDTIPNNNFNGQVCIHFTNSKTHESNKMDTDHQAAIEYAWKNAPNGHK